MRNLDKLRCVSCIISFLAVCSIIGIIRYYELVGRFFDKIITWQIGIFWANGLLSALPIGILWIIEILLFMALISSVFWAFCFTLFGGDGSGDGVPI